MTVLVCTTCPRYDAVTGGSFVGRFTAACERVGADGGSAPTLRRVQCLGGCPRAGVVAIDGSQKARIRFTGLISVNDDIVAELCRFAAAHEHSATGHPNEVGVPVRLTPHLSSITCKRATH
ncbi:hypothetical protein [Janibacter sp. DB-40]|uniref:hypothetical protein n=1 Tax=Janibacter sp. DB-40 TaxID=3028808 RepID=UPI00240699BF|nr:hypothetical protein [Janibacter sp. DB-40]